MGRKSNSSDGQNHNPNPKRAAAKLKKGRGVLAMKAANMEQPEWSQKYDPLYKVKGKKRHGLTS